MKLKMLIALALLVLFILVSVPNAESECIVNFTKETGNYTFLETITVEMSCSSGNEKNKAYTLLWANSTADTAETDVGTTPGIIDEIFIETFTIPSTFDTFINASLNGLNLEGNDSAMISSASANQLLIVDIKTTGTFLGLSSSIDVDVTDENNKKITGGVCNVRVQDPTIDENFVIIQEPMSDGDFDASWNLDYTKFREGKDYEVQLTCFCGSDGSENECIDEDGTAVESSVGSTFAPFTTSTWIDIINDPFPIVYKNGTAFPNATLFAGFDFIHWFSNISNNNPDLEPLTGTVSIYLVNNDTGRSFGEPLVSQKILEYGNTTAITNYRIPRDTETGIYFIDFSIDVFYKDFFAVAHYDVRSQTFNVTSIQDTITLNAVDVHEFFDNSLNFSSSTQSSTSLPPSNSTNPFTLLTEGFNSGFCLNITNSRDEEIELFLDSLHLENPTISISKILVTPNTREEADIPASLTEEICFDNILPIDLDTHSDYRFSYEFHIGNTEEDFKCDEGCAFSGITDFFYVSTIEDMIIIPKFITAPNSTHKGRPGVFIMNEKNEKLYMFDDYNYTSQTDTDWDNSTATCLDKDDGTAKRCDLSVYASAGKDIKACFEAKSYFRNEVSIIISDVSLDRDVEESFILLSDKKIKHTIKSTTDSDMYLSLAPSRAYEGDGNLTDGRNFFCTDFMKLPMSTFGGNDWDIQMQFALDKDIYDLPKSIEWTVESDEFPVFGRIESQPDWGLHLFSPIHYNIPEKWYKKSDTQYEFNLSIPSFGSDAKSFTFGEHLPFRIVDEDTPFERVVNITITYQNGSDISYSTETFTQFGEIVALIKNVDLSLSDNNFTLTANILDLGVRSTEALENSASARIKNNLLKTNYFNSEFIATPTAVESGLMKFYINVTRIPDNGDTYRVTYLFFARSGLGELVDSIETEIDSIGNHSVFLRSTDLNPDGASETYEVRTVVGMRNENGLWEDFDITNIGNITITSVGAFPLGGGSTPGFYDFIINLLRDKYESGDEVKVKIVIKNTGDAPDHDTELEYFLTDPDGRKGSVTLETFLVVPQIGLDSVDASSIPIGCEYDKNQGVICERSLVLPSVSQLGDWCFNGNYFTITQPMIPASDCFEVVDKLTLIEGIQGLSLETLGGKNTFFIMIVCLLILIGVVIYIFVKRS